MFFFYVKINYSELARQYGVMQLTKLGNMVVKEFLETNNVQLSRFKQFREKTPAARRRLNRMQGGEISVPLPRTNDQIRETLKVESFCDISTVHKPRATLKTIV